ncbi:plastocyanin/azurin family copper-binding protein [Pseudolysobacter antarcticus]|nr:plastocyanin/azurin family copper-binding protein [Pseudolysobacter antarcticus]
MLIGRPLSALAANFNVLAGSGGTVFFPASITIAPGDTITFKNSGGLHNVVANDGSFRCANGCDNDGNSGNGNVSASSWHATVIFPSIGTFGYFCEEHGTATTGMRGQIIVKTTTPVQLQSFYVN